ncbi:MAG: ABC transporter permease [Clostridiales bacterium]|nr:ABC transporter permease [Clostridiales bacterium]
MNKKLWLVLRWVFLAVVLACIYLPILLIIVYSFSSERNIGSDNGFGEFTFSLYGRLFQNDLLMEATLNTLGIGLASALLATFIGTFTAVGLYYMRKGKKAVNLVSQVTVVNAEIVTAVGFLLLSIFLRDVIHIPIEKGVLWLIITHTVLTTPYVILTVSPRLNQLNPNLYEAGLDLGARPMRTLFTVIMPQLIGGMVSGFALAFTLSLDDFVVTNLNKGTSGVNTISTYVYDNLKRNLDPAIRALSTIIFVVVLVVLIVFNIIKNKKAKAEQAASKSLGK